jgi:hypothetical protein
MQKRRRYSRKLKLPHYFADWLHFKLKLFRTASAQSIRPMLPHGSPETQHV